jgi:VanZ family protein
MRFRIARRIYQWVFIAALCAIYLLAVLPSDSLPGIQLWDKLNHALAFFVLAALLAKAWPAVPMFSLRLGVLLVYGLFIELSQLLLPYRDASWQDMVANATGLLLYALVHYALCRWRHPALL